MKSVVVDTSAYDSEADCPLLRASCRTIIYEMHVRGFTRNPNSGVAPARRGTFASLIDKIPYPAELGITAVELMPVVQFGAMGCPPGLENSAFYILDGFTLKDLVSYDRKHNDANGEDGRDGASDDRSWSCGAEGSTDTPAIESLRNRQVKNSLTIVMLSLGVQTNWFDWSLLEKHPDVRSFVTLLASRRLLRDIEPEEQRISLNQLLRKGTRTWHGTKPQQPDCGVPGRTVWQYARNYEKKDSCLTSGTHTEKAWILNCRPTRADGGDGSRRWIDTMGIARRHCNLAGWSNRPRQCLSRRHTLRWYCTRGLADV